MTETKRYMRAPRLCSWIVVLMSTALLCGRASGQADLGDLTGDGVPEFAEVELGAWGPGASVGVVRVLDGAGGGLLYELSSGEPGDGFGFAVGSLPDVNGDGIGEMIVTLPRGRLGHGPVGEARVYSGADGAELYALRGANGDRFGMAVLPAETLPDGRVLIRVMGMALDLSGVPVDRLHVFDGSDGRRVSSRSLEIGGVVAAIVPDGAAWGDINRDEEVDTEDVVTLLSGVAAGEAVEGGDLNGDSSVNAADVGVLAGAIGGGGAGGGPIGPVSEPVAAPAWQALGDAMALWTTLYPEDPIAFSLGSGVAGGAKTPNWWFGEGFRPRGEILGSGWLDASLGIGGDPAIVLDEHGQRAMRLRVDVSDEVECDAGVSITSYPDSVLVGSLITVCAAVEGDCGNIEWRMDFAGTSTGWFAGGACHVFTAPVMTADLPPTASVTVLVRCAGCPGAMDSVEIPLRLCTVYVEQADFVPGGSTYTVTAYGIPEGGTYDWEIVTGSEMVTSFVESGASVTVTVRDQYAGTAYTPVVPVNLLVTYTTANCTSWALSTGAVVLDSDGDGLDDRDESSGCHAAFYDDPDGDGLGDADEHFLGTDPCDEDTDDDGLSDGCEVAHGFDPLGMDSWVLELQRRDTDHDGLSDFSERSFCEGTGTSPEDWDTDNDGINDGCEVANGTNPLDPESPSDASDLDGDGAAHAQEVCSGTDPSNPDTDGDGLLDGFELQYMACSDPLDPDSDGDGLLDGHEFHVYGTDPCNIDTDGDGLTDHFELSTVPTAPNGSGAYTALLDPLSRDTDGDGVADSAEDLDGDGLSNGDEQHWASNPLEEDTDGDGQSDSEEAQGGSDPTDPRLLVGGAEDEWFARVRMRVHSNGGKGSWQLQLTSLTTGKMRTTPPCAFESTDENAAENVVILRRGEVYDVRVCFNRTEPDFWFATCENDFSYCASVASEDPQKWPAIVEDPDGILSCYGTPLLCYDSHECNPARGVSARLYLPILDIDLDSDNDGVNGEPSRSAEEDAFEDDAERNGKLAWFRGGDVDADGVPDWMDGFDLTPDPADDRVTPDEDGARGFVPVVVEMAGFPPLEEGESYELEFAYDASDPNGIMPIDPQTGRFDRPAGKGRLWTADQLAARDHRSVAAIDPAEAGSSVDANRPIPVERLGLTSGGQTTATLYYEALEHSEAIGDIAIGVRVVGDARFEDLVRATTPRLEVVTKSYTAETDGEEYEPFAVVDGSDPRPEVRYEIIGEGALAPVMDPVSLSLTVHAAWSVSDALSGVVPVTDRLEALNIFVDGQLVRTEYLSGACVGEEFPFRECVFEASGVMQLTIPARVSADGRPVSWGARAIVVEARTTANAAGRVGYDRGAVVFRLEETQNPQAPGAFVSMEADPLDPLSEAVLVRPVIDRVERLGRSEPGSMEPLVFRLWPVDEDTAADLRIGMEVPPAAGTQARPTLQPYELEPLDPERPHVQYVTATVGNRPLQLVLLMDDEAAALPPVLPDNIRAIKQGRKEVFQIGLNRQSGADERYESVVIMTMAKYQELQRDSEAPSTYDRPLNEGDIRFFYELMVSDDDAMRRLQTFEQWGGTIEIVDVGYIPFTDWFAPPFKLVDSRRLLIDDDVTAPEAAQYLATALKQVLASSLYRDFAMQRWDITEVDLALWEDACDAMIAEMGAAAGSWAQVLPMILSVVSEPVDFIITLHELSEGKYEAAVGLLPGIPANALSQGKRVLIRSSDGTQLMRLSASQLQSVRQVMNPASNMSVQQAASTLRQAGLNVQQRIAGIQSGQFPQLSVLKKKSRSTKRYRKLLEDAGSPMPNELREGWHKPQVHHVLPYEHWEWFAAHGIDIDDVEYLRWMRRSEHSKIHGTSNRAQRQYNAWWKQRMELEEIRIASGGGEYTIAEIRQLIDSAKGLYGVTEDVAKRMWTVVAE